MTIKELANIHKALANENRLEIFLSILNHQQNQFDSCDCIITGLIEKLNIGAPTVSHHLKELVNAKLIDTRKEGKYLVATVNKETLNALQAEFTDSSLYKK